MITELKNLQHLPSFHIELKEDSDHTWWPSTRYIPEATSFVTNDYDSGPLQAQGLDHFWHLSGSIAAVVL